MSSVKRKNRISGQFSPRLIEMLESPAYRTLSLSAHRVISRIEVELGQHGGNDNGKLPVTTMDFVQYGVERTCVPIREAEALGFIRVTEHGRGGNAEFRKPNLFALTFAHDRDSRKAPPTHDWRKIKTLDEAEEIASAARANKDPIAVSKALRSMRKTGRQKPTEVGPENPGRNQENPSRKNQPTGSGKTQPTFYISGRGDCFAPQVFCLANGHPRQQSHQHAHHKDLKPNRTRGRRRARNPLAKPI